MEDIKVYVAAFFISLFERAREDLAGLLLTVGVGLMLRPDRRMYALMLTSYFCYVVGGVTYQYVAYAMKGGFEDV